MSNVTFTPVELTLYNSEDEVIKTVQKSIIPWGVMKKAINLSKKITGDAFNDEVIDALTTFVCQVFNDQVTRQEVEEGVDISEVYAVFRTVMNRANKLGNA